MIGYRFMYLVRSCEKLRASENVRSWAFFGSPVAGVQVALPEALFGPPTMLWSSSFVGLASSSVGHRAV